MRGNIILVILIFIQFNAFSQHTQLLKDVKYNYNEIVGLNDEIITSELMINTHYGPLLTFFRLSEEELLIIQREGPFSSLPTISDYSQTSLNLVLLNVKDDIIIWEKNILFKKNKKELFIDSWSIYNNNGLNQIIIGFRDKLCFEECQNIFNLVVDKNSEPMSVKSIKKSSTKHIPTTFSKIENQLLATNDKLIYDSSNMSSSEFEIEFSSNKRLKIVNNDLVRREKKIVFTTSVGLSQPNASSYDLPYPLVYKRHQNTQHIFVSYISDDSLIVFDRCLNQSILLKSSKGIYENKDLKISYSNLNYLNDQHDIQYLDKDYNNSYTFSKVEETYQKLLSPNVYLINTYEGERIGLIFKDNVFYDPFELRDTSKYFLSEIAMQLSFNCNASAKRGESRYELRAGNKVDIKRTTLELDKKTSFGRYEGEIEVYSLHQANNGCLIGDCFNGYGVKRLILEMERCLLIEGNFINGKLEGEGMVSTVIDIGRGIFSSKLIVNHSKGVPNGNGLEYLCGLRYDHVDDMKIYRKGLWKDGVFVNDSGIDNSEPDDRIFHQKGLKEAFDWLLNSPETKTSVGNCELYVDGTWEKAPLHDFRTISCYVNNELKVWGTIDRIDLNGKFEYKVSLPSMVSDYSSHTSFDDANNFAIYQLKKDCGCN